MGWVKYVVVGGIAYASGLLTVPVITAISKYMQDSKSTTTIDSSDKPLVEYHKLYDSTANARTPYIKDSEE